MYLIVNIKLKIIRLAKKFCVVKLNYGVNPQLLIPRINSLLFFVARAGGNQAA